MLSLVVSESAWGIDQRGRRKLSGGQGSGLKGTRRRLRLASKGKLLGIFVRGHTGQ